MRQWPGWTTTLSGKVDIKSFVHLNTASGIITYIYNLNNLQHLPQTNQHSQRAAKKKVIGCDELHAVDEMYHACAWPYPFVIIVVKKRKRAVEKATKQKSTDGKPPNKKQKRDGT